MIYGASQTSALNRQCLEPGALSATIMKLKFTLLVLGFIYCLQGCSHRLFWDGKYSNIRILSMMDSTNNGESIFEGEVFDCLNNAAAMNAPIKLIGLEERTIRTDLYGKFSFEVAPGKYYLEFTDIGFEKIRTKEIEIRPNTTMRLKVCLLDLGLDI